MSMCTPGLSALALLGALGAPQRVKIDSPGPGGPGDDWAPKRSDGCGQAFPVGELDVIRV